MTKPWPAAATPTNAAVGKNTKPRIASRTVGARLEIRHSAASGTPAPLPQQKGSKQQPVLGLERQESEPQPAAELGAAPQRQKRLGQHRSQKQHRLAKQENLQDRQSGEEDHRQP